MCSKRFSNLVVLRVESKVKGRHVQKTFQTHVFFSQIRTNVDVLPIKGVSKYVPAPRPDVFIEWQECQATENTFKKFGQTLHHTFFVDSLRRSRCLSESLSDFNMRWGCSLQRDTTLYLASSKNRTGLHCQFLIVISYMWCVGFSMSSAGFFSCCFVWL